VVAEGGEVVAVRALDVGERAGDKVAPRWRQAQPPGPCVGWVWGALEQAAHLELS